MSFIVTVLLFNHVLGTVKSDYREVIMTETPGVSRRRKSACNSVFLQITAENWVLKTGFGDQDT
jgi:hypothetical protein